MGKLVLVATPLGNLGDMSYRGIEALKGCDAIACEDTRHSLRLLNHFEISKPLISCHAHSDEGRRGAIVKRILEGETICYVSDAGTPCISDPGTDLVRLAREAGAEVESIPGPAALITALTLSGLDASRFFFEGFLPGSSAKKKQRLNELLELTYTTIIYESPHSLKDTLTRIAGIAPKRRLCVCRELTKLHEETLVLSAQQMLEHFIQTAPRGEFVILIEGAKEVMRVVSDDERDELLKELLNGDLDKTTAAKEAAKQLGIPKRELYARIIELSEE